MYNNALRFYCFLFFFSIIPALIIGGGRLTVGAVWGFCLLSIVIPLILWQKESTRAMIDGPWRGKYYFYGWLLFNVFVQFTPAPIHMDSNTSLAMTVITTIVVLLIACIILVGLGWLLAIFFNRPVRCPVVHRWLDMAVISLPIPFILIDNLLYLNLTNPIVRATINPQAILSYMAVFMFLHLLFTIGTIVLYLYPWDKEVIRMPRYASIVVTAIVWLAINGHIMYGWKPAFLEPILLKLFPVFQGNPLIIFTPLILQAIVLLIAYTIGYLVERALLKRQADKAAI